MPAKTQKNLKQMMQPFAFALKEGSKIQKNFLDYALVMLQLHCTEVIKKPKREAKLSFSKKKAPSNRVCSAAHRAKSSSPRPKI